MLGPVFDEVYRWARYELVNTAGSLLATRRVRRLVAELLTAASPSRVLDVGSGPGPLLGYAPPSAWIVSLDPSAEGLRSVADAGFDAVVGVAEALPFRRGSFDAVVSVFAFRLLNGARAAAEMARASRRLVVVADLWRPRNPLLLAYTLIHFFTIYLTAAALLAPRVLRTYMLIPRSLLRSSPGRLEALVRAAAGPARSLRVFGAFVIVVGRVRR